MTTKANVIRLSGNAIRKVDVQVSDPENDDLFDLDDEDGDEVMNPGAAFGIPEGVFYEVMHSLRRTRRKEFAAKVVHKNGKALPKLAVIAQYSVCPVCGDVAKQFNWMDLGREGLAGPFCDRCLSKEKDELHHEDGMTYGDSRMYALTVDQESWQALALFVEQVKNMPPPEPSTLGLPPTPPEEDDDGNFF